jgi:hypothetical protein
VIHHRVFEKSEKAQRDYKRIFRGLRHYFRPSTRDVSETSITKFRERNIARSDGSIEL